MYQFSLEGLAPVKVEPYPFIPLQKEWLKALRSGKYKQGRGWLRDAEDGFCCLGVMCELAGYTPIKRYAASRAYEYEGFGGELPPKLTKMALFRDATGLFEQNVKFPGVAYGVRPDDPGAGGHGSLAAMNDAAILPMQAFDAAQGLANKWRSFSFNEIADYIEFDPWNVFKLPEVEAGIG